MNRVPPPSNSDNNIISIEGSHPEKSQGTALNAVKLIAQVFSNLNTKDLDSRNINQSTEPSSNNKTTVSLVSIKCNSVPLFQKNIENQKYEEDNGFDELDEEYKENKELKKVGESLKEEGIVELCESEKVIKKIQEDINESQEDIKKSQEKIIASQNLIYKSQDEIYRSQDIIKESQKTIKESEDTIKESQDLIQESQLLIQQAASQAESIASHITDAVKIFTKDKNIKATGLKPFIKELKDKFNQIFIEGNGKVSQKQFEQIFDEMSLKYWRAGLLTDPLTGNPISKEMFEEFKAALKGSLHEKFRNMDWFILPAPLSQPKQSKDEKNPDSALVNNSDGHNIKLFPKPKISAETSKKEKQDLQLSKKSLNFFKITLLTDGLSELFKKLRENRENEIDQNRLEEVKIKDIHAFELKKENLKFSEQKREISNLYKQAELKPIAEPVLARFYNKCRQKAEKTT